MKNSDTVGVIAKLLASSQDEVEKALCYRVVAARGEVVEKGHSVKDAIYARDAFAKVSHLNLRRIFLCIAVRFEVQMMISFRLKDRSMMMIAARKTLSLYDT